MSKEPNNLRIVPIEKKYKGAPTLDNTLDVTFEGEKRLMVEGDRTVILNLAERFNKERQGSDKIRVTGKITNLFDNIVSGKTTYTPFENSLYYVDPINSVNTNTWRGYPQYDEFSFLRKSVPAGHIDFVPKSSTTYNWTAYLSYVSDNVTGQSMTYKNEELSATTVFTVSDGIPFAIKNRRVNGKDLITFYCAGNHNLSNGEYVKLSFDYNGESYFQVFELGDEDYDSNSKVFSIYNLGYTGTTFGDGVSGTLKRVINKDNAEETTSKYYVRKHKILTEVKDYNMARMGFENTPFSTDTKLEYSALTPNNVQRTSTRNGSSVVSYTFEKQIDISKYKDNQERPLTELYVTIINKGYVGWFNKPYGRTISAMNVGWEFNCLSLEVDQWWKQDNFNNRDNIPFNSYQKNNQTFYYNEDLHEGDEIMGDFCEWNDFEMEEYVVSPMLHKYSFNGVIFQDDSTMVLPSGYLYYPHHKIQVRDFSPYVEVGNPEDVDYIPNYAFYSDYEGQWRWRDLYPYGFIDETGVGVDHPFLNGAHYPFKEITFLQVQPQRTLNYGLGVITQPLIDDCE
jgi:hypothetical protein